MRSEAKGRMAGDRSGIPSSVLERVAGIVGAGNLKRGEQLAAIDPGFDRKSLDAGVAVLPGSVAEVAAILELAQDERLPIVTHGGRTGLAHAGTSRAGELILMTNRLAAIRLLDAAGGLAVTEAGVTLQTLNDAAARHGLSAGIDLGARGSCTIGGMIATNAGGMEAFRYGTMRQRVLGLEAVLPGGRIMSDLTRVTKANAGYDVKQLFIGSEGTLGVVTAAVIKLEPTHAERATALAGALDATTAVALFRRLQRLSGATLTHAELMWRRHVEVNAREMGREALSAFSQGLVYVMIEVGGDSEVACLTALETALGEAVEAGEIDNAILAKSEEERRDIWHLREFWGVDRVYPGGLWFDISVPLSGLAAYAEALEARLAQHDPALRLYMIGHLGDGNLHVTVNADRPILERYGEVSALVYQGLAEAGGSFSAEHGIGLEKKSALAKLADPGKLALMRLIKSALDPHGIMNPGKVVDLAGH